MGHPRSRAGGNTKERGAEQQELLQTVGPNWGNLFLQRHGQEHPARRGRADFPIRAQNRKAVPTAVHRSELHHLIRLPGVTPGLERKEISRESTMPVPAHTTSSLQGAEPCTGRPGPPAPHKQRPQVSAATCKGGVPGPEGRICRQGDPRMMLDKQPKLVGRWAREMMISPPQGLAGGHPAGGTHGPARSARPNLHHRSRKVSEGEGNSFARRQEQTDARVARRLSGGSDLRIAVPEGSVPRPG